MCALPASILSLPTEIILEYIFPHLSDIDVYSLGEACDHRIKQLAAHQVPLGNI